MTNTQTAAKAPRRTRLVAGRTYRFEFHTPDGTLAHGTTITVAPADHTWSDARATALNSWVSRWVRYGRHTATITEVGA